MMLEPLQHWYPAGTHCPVCTPLPAEQLPPPQRAILASGRDMTPTLEEHYQCALGLRVLRHEHDAATLTRLVRLVDSGSERVLACGAIRILLAALPSAAAQEVTACRTPLGRIMAEHGVAHVSRATGFFSLPADSLLQDILGCPPHATLYGRRNRILSPTEVLLADVVEVLPTT